MPPQCAITTGIATILEARKIVLLAAGRRKARAFAQAVEGPVTASVTASALQFHPDITLIVDEEAASELGQKGYYPTGFGNDGSSHPLPSRVMNVTQEDQWLIARCGEVTRNPYHLTLPARLKDNVRRGSEILGSFGKEARPFLFAELYKVSVMKNLGREAAVLPEEVIAPDQALGLEGPRLLAKPPTLSQ